MTSAAGYPAPGVLAVAGAFLVAYHEPRVWFIVLLALGLLNVILWIRNVFGFVVMAAWLCGVGWLFTRGTAGIDALFGALTVWYLAAGGLRAATEVPRPPRQAMPPILAAAPPAGRACKAGFVLLGLVTVVATARILTATAG